MLLVKQGWLRGRLFDIVLSNQFEIAIVCVVTLNMILMMMQRYDQPESMRNALHIL